MVSKRDKAAKPKAEEGDDKKPANMRMWVGAGIGAGIGSAAIAAALLYANRAKGKPEVKKDAPETD